MNSWSVSVVLFCTFLLVTPSSQAKGTRALKGNVKSVTAKRVYLDRGSDQGLATGHVVVLYKGKRKRGTCTVEFASSRTAACTLGDDVRAGFSTFRTQVQTSDIQQSGSSTKHSANQSTRTSARRQRSLHNKTARLRSSFSLVDFQSPPRGLRSGFTAPSNITFTYRGSGTSSAISKMFHTGRLDVSLYGAQLHVPGLRLFLRATVEGGMVPSTSRYFAGQPAHFTLHEAALRYRHANSFVSGAAGRFTPWGVPGVTVIDGAQAAVHFFDGAVELGAYGGTLPTTDLWPRWDAFLGGAYWGLRTEIFGISTFHRGRVGVLSDINGSFRAEGEGFLSVRFDQYLSLFAGARAGVGLDDGVSPGLDLAYVQVQSEPIDGLRLGTGYRFSGPGFVDDALGAWPNLTKGDHHATLDGTWETMEWLSLRLAGTIGWVPAASLRAQVGPEIGLPRLFDGAVGTFLGWQEAVGDSGGRLIYLRGFWRSGFGLYIGGRAYYGDYSVPFASLHTAGGDVRFEQRIGFFRTWASLRGEAPLPSILRYTSASVLDSSLSARLGISADF